MLDEAAIRKFTREVYVMSRTLTKLNSILKSDGGRLTAAGVAVLQEAKRQGMSNAEIARLLKITPAAVSYQLAR